MGSLFPGVLERPGVYLIRNVSTGECYIGSSINMGRRIAGHFSWLRAKTHPNVRMQAAFIRDGEEHFVTEALDTVVVIDGMCDRAALLEREEWYIIMIQPTYNATLTELARKTRKEQSVARQVDQRTVDNITPITALVDRAVFTTAQVAAALGMQVQAVQKLARKRGLGTRIGKPPTSSLVFTPAEVEALRDRRVGYPAGRPNTPEHRAAITAARRRPWSQARREAFTRRREAQDATHPNDQPSQ